MISINRNLDLLIEACESYNLIPTPTKTNKKGIKLTVFDSDEKTVSKEDCVRCLQKYFVDIYKNENRYTEALNWMLKTEFQPMLAAQLKNCKWKDDIYNKDNEVIAETKIDGNRSLWCLFNKNEGIQIFSRNLSVQDYLPLCYTDKVVLNNVDVSKLTHTFVVDGEIVISKVPDDSILEGFGLEPGTTQLNLTSALLASDKQETLDFQKHYPLKLMIFDIVVFDDEDLTDKPLSERLKYRDIVYKEMLEAGFCIEKPKNNRDLNLTVEDFHKKMLIDGEEGSIVKTLNGLYDMSGSRSHNAWIKLKRSVGDSVASSLGDTIDGFITGFHNIAGTDNNSWRVSTVEFSAYLTDNKLNIDDLDTELDLSNITLDQEVTDGREIKVIANVSGLTEDDARLLSEPDPDNPGFCRLKKEAYGVVAELNGQDISPRSLTLTHPRIIRWRDDKPMDQCEVSKEFLESYISKRGN